MLGDTVVPNDDSALLPLDARLEVGTVCKVIIQELEDRLGLLLLQANNVAGDYVSWLVSTCQRKSVCSLTLRVDEERLLASSRVCADDRVLIDNGLTTHDATTSTRGIGLLNSRVTSLQAVQTLTEGWAKPLVGLDSVDEESVSASLGLLQHVQESRAGRLALVRDVTVPSYGARAVGKVLVNSIVAGATVNQVNLREALGGARGWVDVVAVTSVRDQLL